MEKLEIHYTGDSWDFDDKEKLDVYEVLGEEVTITADTIGVALVGFIESGITEMFTLDVTGSLWEQKPQGVPYSIWATNILLNGEALTLEEDESEILLPITLESLIKGIKTNAKKFPNDCHPEDGDALTYSRIVQYAIFDEIVYG